MMIDLLQPQLQFNHVYFSYHQKPFLEDLTFHINTKEIIGIIGVTGAGKSTLVHLIPRFYDIQAGHIKLYGKDLSDYDFKTLRNKITVVPQHSSLFSGTVRKNMQWAKRDATDEEIIHALKIAQAYDFVFEMNSGLDTMLYQAGKNLSGGQRQRLCIARAIIGQPDILILDDSASALDYATEYALRQALMTNLKNTTLIIVSQRVNSVKHADKILVLDEGHMVGFDQHTSLYENCSVYRELCQSQNVGGK